jgi:phage FluMu gp28-like protein
VTALPDDEELLDELANVRLRESAPGVYRMDHDPDRHDDRAVALALAAHHLVTRVPRRQVVQRLL